MKSKSRSLVKKVELTSDGPPFHILQCQLLAIRREQVFLEKLQRRTMHKK